MDAEASTGKHEELRPYGVLREQQPLLTEACVNTRVWWSMCPHGSPSQSLA